MIHPSAKTTCPENGGKGAKRSRPPPLLENCLTTVGRVIETHTGYIPLHKVLPAKTLWERSRFARAPKGVIMDTRLLGSVLALSVMLVGCGATPATIKVVQDKQVEPFKASADSKPIEFSRIVVKLKRGQHIGALQGGLFCMSEAELFWKGGRMSVDSDDFTDAFKEEWKNIRSKPLATRARCSRTSPPGNRKYSSRAWSGTCKRRVFPIFQVDLSSNTVLLSPTALERIFFQLFP